MEFESEFFKLNPWPKAVTTILALLVMALGVVVLYAWIVHDSRLIEIYSSVAMVFNTSLSFLLSGMALLLLTRERFLAAAGVGIAVAGIGLTSSLQYALGVDLGIDNLVVNYDLSPSKYPGRMSPNTSINFFMSGLALMSVGLGNRKHSMLLLTGILGGIITAMGMTALLGYVLTIKAAHNWGENPGMALHTALGFSMLGSALILVSWRTEKQAKDNMISSALIPLAVLLICFNVSVWIASRNEQNRQELRLMESELYASRLKINDNFQILMNIVERMKLRWELRSGIPQTEWQISIAPLFGAKPRFRTIAWIDHNFMLRRSLSSTDQETASYPDIAVAPEWLPILKEAQSKRNITLNVDTSSTAIDKELIIAAPLFIKEQSDGFIVAKITLADLFSILNKQLRYRHLALRIANADNETIIDMLHDQPENSYRWSTPTALTPYGLPWTIAIGLSHEEIKQFNVPAEVGIVSTLIISLLAFAAAYSAQRWSRISQSYKEAEERFRLVIEFSPTAKMLVDANGTIVLVNKQFEKLFGYSRSEVLGQTVEMLVPSALRQSHGRLRAEFFADARARPMGAGRSLKGLHKSGREIPVEIGLAPIKINQQLKIIATVFDLGARITLESNLRAALAHIVLDNSELSYIQAAELLTDNERNQLKPITNVQEHTVDWERTEAAILQLSQDELEQKMNQRKQQLIKLNAAQQSLLQNERLATIGAMVAGLAHEMNNPLMGILNYVQFLLAHPDDGRKDQILTKIEREIKRVGKVVREVLMFSRAPQGKLEGQDLKLIVEQALDLLKSSINQNDIHVILNFPKDFSLAMAEADGLEQVLINLLLNAQDAVASCSAKIVHITGYEQYEAVFLTIRDNGEGVNSEIRQRIFEPFFSTKSTRHNTGLGLSVSAAIMRSFGGTLTLKQNDKEPGAEFLLKFAKFQGKIATKT